MSDEPTFAAEIERAAHGETILAVTIGGFGGWSWSNDPVKDGDLLPGAARYIDPANRGVPLPWDEARHLLDYQWDAGYGGADCHAVYAWSERWLVLVAEYDGSTRAQSFPRFPCPCVPEMA